jgi:tRNA(Met) cytidine acetyltransferase
MTFISVFSKWLDQRLAYLQQKDSIRLHRRMIVIAPNVTQETLLMLTNKLSSGLIVSKSINMQTLSKDSTALLARKFSFVDTSKYRLVLGTETDNCVVDARDGINLDALIAVSGLIKPSGLLCIILPSCLAQLPKLQNTGIAHSYKQVLDETFEEYYFYSFFVKALLKQQIISIEQSVSIAAPNTTNIQHLSLENDLADVEKGGSFILNHHSEDLSHCAYKLSEQQQEIVEQVLNSETDVHLILGKRGRGKSTTLAECCIQLNHKFRVYICAPKKSQTATFEEHIGQYHLKNASSIERNEPLYRFLAPDQALDVLAEENIKGFMKRPSLLLLDEVASIAPNLLRKLVALADKTILAGTTQGYEGSGQGFVQRVVPFIQQTYTHKIYELKTSFRWLKDDPIEAFFEEILYIRNNNADIVRPIGHASAKKRNKPAYLDEVSIAGVSKKELLADEAAIESVFSLLREAHYQTSPNDIVRLLDDSAYRLVVARNNKGSKSEIVALAVLIEEGGDLLKPIAKSIAQGKRRTQGHLTPQSLSLYFLNEQWCSYTNLRINRIAVKAAYRRQNIASTLIEYCCSLAKLENINYLSTSYGVNESLFNFWRYNGFTPVKVGTRVDTSSGAVSMVMIKNISLREWPLKQASIERQLNLEALFYRQAYAVKAIDEAMNLLTLRQLKEKPQTDYLNHIKQRMNDFAKNDITLDKVASHFWYFINCYQNMSIQDCSRRHQEPCSNQARRDFLKFFAKGTHKSDKENISFQLRAFVRKNIHLLPD